MQPNETLIQKAASLERVAPLEWRAFIEALAVYTEVHRENAISSPVLELPVNQGRAQALSLLMKTLKNSRETADRINKGLK